MKRGVFSLAMVLLFVVTLFAKDPETKPDAPSELPKSPAAAAAISKSDVAIKKAEDAYLQAVLAANRQCLKELDAALKPAMKDANLDEANRIAAAKKKVTAEIEELVSGRKVPHKADAADKASIVYLADIDPLAEKGSQWALAKGHVGNNLVKIAGTESPNGLGLNPFDGGSARLTYKLDRKYKNFKSGVGINDSSTGFLSRVTFRVFGDGRELWRSKPMSKPGKLEEFDLNVTKVVTLELAADCEGGAAGAHVVWIEPQLTGARSVR